MTAPQSPSQLVARREVTVTMTFLVDGLDQATAEQFVVAGISLNLPQGGVFRGLKVESRPATLDLVRPH